MGHTDLFLSADEMQRLTELCRKNSAIDPLLYSKYDVKRGLRDVNGKGVLTGLTEISEIVSNQTVNGESVPCDGQLFYRGYNVRDLIEDTIAREHFGFEETTYLLIFGELPDEKQLVEFKSILSSLRSLPTNFVRDVVMKASSLDVMNSMARGVLSLYHYDDRANDISVENVLRQCLKLIAVMPMLSVYGYQTSNYYHNGESLYIHAPEPELSTAENLLYMLRSDCSYTELEARVLDAALILHAEHGGGNNSTFTMHVVTSSGTDTYSAFAASLCSLKGFRHGGANIKVVRMFDDLEKNVRDWKDDDEINNYLLKLLNKDAFDNAGLIYGMGHAVYSVSDPRAKIFKTFVEKLSEEKGLSDEFQLYSKVEKLASDLIAQKRKIYKGVSANVDFYSGFAYRMLGLPPELYTPIFAVSRMSGWSAHRLEELINAGKIIRPAYKSVAERREYTPLDKR